MCSDSNRHITKLLLTFVAEAFATVAAATLQNSLSRSNHCAGSIVSKRNSKQRLCAQAQILKVHNSDKTPYGRRRKEMKSKMFEIAHV